MRSWFWIFLFSTSLLLTPAQSPAKEITPISELVCELQDTRIDESSGLAASRKYSEHDLLWTHNDSGGNPELFLVNLQGETVATVLLQDAKNLDWEDIAIANGFVYIGDIGDNWRRRGEIVIYRIPEPQLDPQKLGQTLEVACERMVLKYPDGAADCETLLATASGHLILVSKNGGASRFYRTPAPFENDTTQLLEKCGEYSFTGATAWSYLTTGGDLHPDESRFVVRTYTHAYEWELPENQKWKDISWSSPRQWELPESKQGEAICYSADGQKYFLSSEGVPAPIWRLELISKSQKDLPK